MAIRLTESRLRQIVREEVENISKGRGSRRRIRENADPMFQEYLQAIVSNAEDQEFFGGSTPSMGLAKSIVEDTLVFDFDDVEATPELVDDLTNALMAKHKELSDGGYDGYGGGVSNDGSSFNGF
jgi:hypothetical protein